MVPKYWCLLFLCALFGLDVLEFLNTTRRLRGSGNWEGNSNSTTDWRKPSFILMRFPEAWTVPLFTHSCLFKSSANCSWNSAGNPVFVFSLLRFFFFWENLFPGDFLSNFSGVGNLDAIKRHHVCQLIFFWLNFWKICEMLIAAPKFQVSTTLVAFAGDKSISFCLQIAVVLSVWSFANNYCIFIFAQLIFPSV